MSVGRWLKLENTCAVCLLKHVQYLQDTKGAEITLNYIGLAMAAKLHFAIARKGKVDQLIEVKLSDGNLSAGLRYFQVMLSGESQSSSLCII